MKKSELLERRKKLKVDIAALEENFSSDSDDWSSDDTLKYMKMKAEEKDVDAQLLSIQQVEALRKKQEQDQIAAEQAAGSSDAFVGDLSGFLMDELDGNLMNLGADEIELPWDNFYDEVIKPESAFHLGDTVLLRPHTGTDPDLPRNRATEIGYVDVTWDTPTSIFDIMPKQETGDSKITYNELLTHDPAATGNNRDGVAANIRTMPGVIAEGGVVTESNYALRPKTVNMVDYGFHTTVTRQAARDVVRLRSELGTALRADMRQAMDLVVYNAIKGLGTTITEAAAEGLMDQLIEVVDAASDATNQNTQVYLLRNTNWNALKREANLKTATYDLSGFFRGRGRSIDGIPVVTSPVIEDKKPFGGNFSRRFFELYIRNNVRMEVGRIDDDFLRRQSRIMITMEAVLAVKFDKVFGRIKNNPTNTAGWFA